MCGRLVVVVPDLSELVAPYGVMQNVAGTWQPRFNLAPTQLAPAITNEASRRLDLLRFGFAKEWQPRSRGGRPLINARAETVSKLRSFRRALALRRCIVPVTGYYEWQVQDGRKRPQYIRTANGALISLACVWERWRSRDGEEVEGFAIITRAAQGFVRGIHDRMPLAVRGDQLDVWLDPHERDASSLAAVLEAAPELDTWTAHEVAPLVNSVDNDSADCIADYTAPPPAPERQLDLFAALTPVPRPASSPRASADTRRRR